VDAGVGVELAGPLGAGVGADAHAVSAARVSAVRVTAAVRAAPRDGVIDRRLMA